MSKKKIAIYGKFLPPTEGRSIMPLGEGITFNPTHIIGITNTNRQVRKFDKSSTKFFAFFIGVLFSRNRVGGLEPRHRQTIDRS
jgi:hypothetical protein